MFTHRIALAAMMAAAALAAPVQAKDNPGPIAIHGNKQTFEIAPVLLAAEKYYPGEASVKMGGIPNLVGEPIIPGFGEEGVADVATHAETQALRYSVRHPDLRIILNVTRGHYSIVARKSAGIAMLGDIKGKRIATIPQTSAGYFLYRMLNVVELDFDDVEIVALQPGTPLSSMTEAMAKGEVDAIAIWEPESSNAGWALNGDRVEFSGRYEEHFNLNTTAENLADPVKRAKIVAFTRAVIEAAGEVRRDPAEAKRLVREQGGFTELEIFLGWPQHEFGADFPEAMLDLLVDEEQWLAAQDKRPARSREELAKLIDTSVYEEAMALGR